VTEGEQEVMDGEPEAPEQEPGESVRWYLSRRQQQEMRDLSNRPQMSVLLRLKVSLALLVHFVHSINL
jgi:hypothetical protein